MLERRTVGVDELAAAVEPFTLGHAAHASPTLTEAELTRAARRGPAAGPVAIDTGTGVTMAASRQRHPVAGLGR